MYNYNSLFLFHLVTCIPVNRNNESTWEGCVVLFAVGGYPVGVAIAHKRKMLKQKYIYEFLGLASSPYETSTVCPSVRLSVSNKKFSYFPPLDFSDFLHEVSLQ